MLKATFSVLSCLFLTKDFVRASQCIGTSKMHSQEQTTIDYCKAKATELGKLCPWGIKSNRNGWINTDIPRK